MEIERHSASLGWKFTTDRRSDPSRRLMTSDDVDHAFKCAVDRIKTARIKREVVIEIVNLVNMTSKFASDYLLFDHPNCRYQHQRRKRRNANGMML
jgi:hypothetical protein